MDIELGALVERYHELTDTLKEMDLEYAEATKPYNAAIQAIETECLARLQAQGLQNAKTPHGTAHLATQTRVSVRDKFAFFTEMLMKALIDCEIEGAGGLVQPLFESGAFSMLDIRALKEPVKEFVKEHSANPPGVEVSHWVECHIRKS